MIIFRSREKLRCQELWFNESERAGKYDIVVRNQSSAPMSGRRSEEFHTLLIDLTPQPQQIFASFDRNTRSQIRAAEADERVTVEIIESASATQLAEFLNFYDDFSRSKSIWPIWAPRLRALHESHRLVLSRVIRDQETLVWHASLRTDERFIVLYSAGRPVAAKGDRASQSTTALARDAVCQGSRLPYLRFLRLVCRGRGQGAALGQQVQGGIWRSKGRRI